MLPCIHWYERAERPKHAEMRFSLCQLRMQRSKLVGVADTCGLIDAVLHAFPSLSLSLEVKHVKVARGAIRVLPAQVFPCIAQLKHPDLQEESTSYHCHVTCFLAFALHRSMCWP